MKERKEDMQLAEQTNDTDDAQQLADAFAEHVVDTWQRRGGPLPELGAALLFEAVGILGRCGGGREEIAAMLRELADAAEGGDELVVPVLRH